jgi:DNA polymerase III gamma/tau subunit
VTSTTVSAMLGTLDDEQPLGLLEALVDGDGQQVMSLLSQAASRGVEWEALLVEMLRLLHQIAMVQLLPASLNDDDESNALRLRELARVVPPADLQLYYQTLLMGRKDLPIAPDRRMGVEMTLLRALAFHPKAAVAEPIARPTLTRVVAAGNGTLGSAGWPASNCAVVFRAGSAASPASRFRAVVQPAADCCAAADGRARSCAAGRDATACCRRG